jgi:DNA-binding transcriptional MerR regulator
VLSEYRLDELATLSGVSVRNIRAYRERGLLDAPRREGRWAFYDDRHLAQLRAVNELLRKGYTSAHIAEFLAGTREGHDLADILGLQQAVFGPPRHAASVALAVDPDGDDARRLLQYGLAEIADGAVTLVNPNIAEIVGRAADQLLYVRAMLRIRDGIAGLLDELAAAVVDASEQSLLPDLGEDFGRKHFGPEGGDAVELRRTVADYRAIAHYVVADQLDDALQRRLDAQASGDTAGAAVGPCHAEGR